MNSYVYITFEALYDALLFEKTCKDKGIAGKLVSVPRELSAGCGYAWRMDESQHDFIQNFCQKSTLRYQQITVI